MAELFTCLHHVYHGSKVGHGAVMLALACWLVAAMESWFFSPQRSPRHWPIPLQRASN
jgi:hypothetical protein